MKKTFAALLAGSAMLTAIPASAGTFLVELGTNIGSPGSSSGSYDAPRVRVVNTTPGSATTPLLTSLVLTLDAGTTSTVTGVTNFGQGNYTPGIDDTPSIGNQSGNTSVASGGKSVLFDFVDTQFDPGAYASFTVNFGPGTTDFRTALFTGTNTLFASFSDGTSGLVTFSGSVGDQSPKFSFNSVTPGGAVPEPATWAMMILGFGLVGGAMRSARTQAKIRFA